MRAGIEGLTFHDLRGTAVVTLALAGRTEAEIYAIIGQQPSDLRAIRRRTTCRAMARSLRTR